jgi:hypothetical protein
MGHAIYYVVIRQQMKKELGDGKPLSAKTQYRPSAGFTLTQESWCKIDKLCQTNLSKVEGYIDDAENRCVGGARHSVRIFAPDEDKRWHFTTPLKTRNDYFAQEIEERCRK